MMTVRFKVKIGPAELEQVFEQEIDDVEFQSELGTVSMDDIINARMQAYVMDNLGLNVLGIEISE